MPVLDYLQQDGPFLWIKRNKEEVVEYQQLAALHLLHLGIEVVPYLCNLQRAKEFGGIRRFTISGPNDRGEFQNLLKRCRKTGKDVISNIRTNYYVKSLDNFHLVNKEYMDYKQNNMQILEQQFSELLSMINYHRSLASQAVNEQQLLLAWNVGAYVSTKLKTEQWGSKVVTQFSEYIK